MSLTLARSSAARSTYRCAACHLVYFLDEKLEAQCPRCAAQLDLPTAEVLDASGEVVKARIGWRERALMVALMVSTILILIQASLLITSNGLTSDERQTVTRAVELLRDRGFTSEALMLSTVTSFRRTDNWFNRYTKHDTAYAATNFPFQILTLYPDFFTVTVDDTERAMVLLHEARHLYGANEPRAYAETWRARTQLGWTRDRYATTRTFRGVEKLTREYAPQLFSCGLGNDKDCVD